MKGLTHAKMRPPAPRRSGSAARRSVVGRAAGIISEPIIAVGAAARRAGAVDERRAGTTVKAEVP